MANANGHPPTCDAAEARLLDLVYGELEDGEASALRAHAEGCDACGRSLAKLEGGRAIARRMNTAEDAPAAVMSAVLAAARAKAGENQRAAARARIAATERPSARPASREGRRASEAREGSWLADVLRKLGSIATGPQVAMAMLLLLMVGIGLWSAPRLTSREHGGGTAVLQPDPDGEAGPSAGALTPAEPLRLEVDPRTDRIIDAEELAAAEEQRRLAEPRVPHPEVRRGAIEDQGEDERVAVREAPAEASGRETFEATGREEQAAALDRGDDAVAAEALAGLEADLAPGEGVGGSVAEAEMPEPTGTGSTVASVERRSIAPSSVPRTTTSTSSGRAPAQASPYSSPGQADPSAERVDSPTLDTSAALAASLHQQAREAGSSGRYAQCVSTYQQVVDRYPTYAQTGRALIEMAECQRRLGQITVAERTLQRAQRHPAVRPDADRRLATLRAERAAMDREVEIEPPAATSAEPAGD